MRTPTLHTLLLLLALLPGAAATAQPGDGTMPDTTQGGSMVHLPQALALKHFSAETHGQGVLLAWTMAVEHDLDHYALERSEDGQLFLQVHTVLPQGAAMQQANYTLNDVPPAEGLFLYRLRLVHAGGAQHMGPTVAVHLRHHHRQMVLFPCPARDQLTVALDHGDDDLRYVLFDRQGNMLREGALASGRTELNITLLPAGLHGMVVFNGRGEVLERVMWMKE
jgi:hypothetical protein